MGKKRVEMETGSLPVGASLTGSQQGEIFLRFGICGLDGSSCCCQLWECGDADVALGCADVAGYIAMHATLASRDVVRAVQLA